MIHGIALLTLLQNTANRHVLPTYLIISHDIAEEHVARVLRAAALGHATTILTTLPGTTHCYTSALSASSITL